MSFGSVYYGVLGVYLDVEHVLMTALHMWWDLYSHQIHS